LLNYCLDIAKSLPKEKISKKITNVIDFTHYFRHPKIGILFVDRSKVQNIVPSNWPEWIKIL